jgi:hypothetical protein
MFLQIKRVGKLCLYFLVIGGPGVFPGCSPYRTQWQEPATKSAIKASNKNPRTPTRMLGDYGRFIHGAGRGMDGPATIKQLKKLHINTYFYLIHHSSAGWRYLLEKFLPAAQKAGINVFVYLSGPSAAIGTKDPNPFGTDYVHWAKVIAQLSLQYSHLKGWAIDDFNENIDTFTPSYVKKMVLAAHKINPQLSFLPVVYYFAASCPCFHRKYSAYIDGIIFPYLGFYNLKRLPKQLDAITKLWRSQSVVLMVYATKHSMSLNPPSADYVRKALQIGFSYNTNGKLGGVMTYKLNKQPHEISCKNYSHLLKFGLEYRVPTKKGDYVKASQKITLDLKAKSYQISFWQRDDRKPSNPRGYHMKQFLVDGRVVWQKDVAEDASKKTYKVSLDLTKYLKGKSNATIAFRLYEKKGVSSYEVRTSFGGFQSKGFHVTNESCFSWTFSSSGNTLFPTHQCHECNPDRQQKMFDAVEKVYGKWSGK